MSNFSLRILRILAAACAAGFLMISGIAVVGAHAEDTPPSGFPSWGDVQSAKGNVAAAQAEVTKISGLLSGLEAESAQLGTVAVQAGANYAVTQRELEAVTTRVEVLSAQAGAAAKDGAKYRKEAVTVAVQSYKSGVGSLGFVAALSALGSQESLQGLDTLQLVGAQLAAKQVKAEQSQSVAAAIGASLKAAESQRATLATQAKASMDAAIAAQTALTAQLVTKKAQSTTLVAQLASLKNTTAVVEQEFRDGQEALAAYDSAQLAKQQAAAQAAARAQAAAAAQAAQQQGASPTVPGNTGPGPTGPRNSGPSPTGPGGYIPVEVLLPNIPGGAVNDQAGAQAYASARLGAFGWGQGQFSCLVQLWNRESSWLTNATNPSSGAYGIAQALPPSKYASAGGDWLNNYRTQIDWGLGYIQYRYGSPCGAWSHSQSVGWY